MSVGLPTNCQDNQNHAPPHVFSRWHVRHAVRQRDGETGASTPYRVARCCSPIRPRGLRAPSQWTVDGERVAWIRVHAKTPRQTLNVPISVTARPCRTGALRMAHGDETDAPPREKAWHLPFRVAPKAVVLAPPAVALLTRRALRDHGAPPVSLARGAWHIAMRRMRHPEKRRGALTVAMTSPSFPEARRGMIFPSLLRVSLGIGLGGIFIGYPFASPRREPRKGGGAAWGLGLGRPSRSPVRLTADPRSPLPYFSPLLLA
jgi:hypothetical protein